MLTRQPTKTTVPISLSTLRFITRYLWSDDGAKVTHPLTPGKNKNKIKSKNTRHGRGIHQHETESLAAALNLLHRKDNTDMSTTTSSATTTSTTMALASDSKSKSNSNSNSINHVQSVYKPSLFKAFTKGSAVEQFQKRATKKAPSTLTTSPIAAFEGKTDVRHLLRGIILTLDFVSGVGAEIDAAKLLNEKDPKKLSLYIKEIQSEKALIDLLELFIHHERLNLRVLGDIVLNPHLINLSKLPIDVTRPENIPFLKGLNVVKFRILMLRKYQLLKQPVSILNDLRVHIETYLALIKEKKLPRNYERTVWRFTLQYLKQFDETHYIESINDCKTSFAIWESTPMHRRKLVAETIMGKHKDELNQLQTAFLRIARVSDSPQLCRIATKYKIESLELSERGLCYAFINDLEKFLIQAKDADLEFTMKELSQVRVDYINSAISSKTAHEEYLVHHSPALHKA